MHLEIVCDSTQILVHWTIPEILQERQDALVGVSVLPALSWWCVSRHHLFVEYISPSGPYTGTTLHSYNTNLNCIFCSSLDWRPDDVHLHSGSITSVIVIVHSMKNMICFCICVQSWHTALITLIASPKQLFAISAPFINYELITAVDKLPATSV